MMSKFLFARRRRTSHSDARSLDAASRRRGNPVRGASGDSGTGYAMRATLDYCNLIALSALVFRLVLSGLATLNSALIVLAIPPVIFIGAALLDMPDVVQFRRRVH